MSNLYTVALCVASLLSGSYGQTSLEIMPSTIEGPIGATVTFYCQLQPGGDSVNIQLLVNNSTNSEGFINFGNETGRLQRDDTIPSRVTYMFGPLSQGDNGSRFQCVSSSDMLSSPEATISVTVAPSIALISPIEDPITRREGTSLVISFNVTANPVPNITNMTQVNLTRNGVRQMNVNGLTLANTLESLTFDPLGREHAGDYVLTVRNAAGEDSAMFTLNVLYPPGFLAPAFTNANCTYNDQRDVFQCAAYSGSPDVTFNCAAGGNPVPTVQISPSTTGTVDTSDNVTIVISSVGDEHAGDYSCYAASPEFPQSNVTRTFRLYVGGTANPVSGVNVNTVGNTLYAVWTYDNGPNAVPATSFNVTVTLNGVVVGETSSVPITARNASLQEVEGLFERGQTYIVTVVAVNLQGTSDAVTGEFTSSAKGVSMLSSLSVLLVVLVMAALL